MLAGTNQLEYKADSNNNELAVPNDNEQAVPYDNEQAVPYDNEQVVPYVTRFPDASLKERYSARVAHKGRCHSLTKIWKLS